MVGTKGVTSVAESPSPTGRASGGTRGGGEGMAGLAKGLAILEVFGPGREQLTVSDAARSTGMWPATARRCLLTLEHLGYLSFDGKFYRPTPRMVRLGASYLETASLPALAQPHAVAARDQLGESVSVGVLDGDDVVFVARAEVQRLVTAAVRLGTQLPAHASASGRVLLADLPDEELAERLERVAPSATTPHTVVDVAGLRERVQRAREDGYATTDEELELGIRTLAVPVRDSTGHVPAALAVSTLTARVSRTELLENFLPVLITHAERLGRQL